MHSGVKTRHVARIVHAGSTGSITLDVLFEDVVERKVAVDWIVEAVFSEPDKKECAAVNDLLP